MAQTPIIRKHTDEARGLKRSLHVLANSLIETIKHKQNVMREINKLQQEQSLIYHIKKDFNAVYGAIPKSSGGPLGDIIDTLLLPWEIGRIVIAYGLFPITVPLTTAYATSEWRSKKENNDKILQQTEMLSNIDAEEKKIQSEIDYLEKLIKEVTIKEQIVEYMRGTDNYRSVETRYPALLATWENIRFQNFWHDVDDKIITDVINQLLSEYYPASKNRLNGETLKHIEQGDVARLRRYLAEGPYAIYIE